MKLYESGVISQEELSSAKVEMPRKRGARDALGHHTEALVAAEVARDAGRAARTAELERQRAGILREVTAAKAEVTRLELEVERRLVRAPIAGVLGDVAEAQTGVNLETSR